MFIPNGNSSPIAIAVSCVHVLAVFLTVYPPPPSKSNGRLNDFTYSIHLACPLYFNFILYDYL